MINRRDFSIGLAGLGLASCATPQSTPTTDVASVYSASDATDLAALVRRGELTRVEVLEEAIRRTEALDPKLNAVVIKHYEMARQQATSSVDDAPFAGVPFLVKNLGIQVAGTETNGGSRLLAGIKAQHDDVLTTRYKRAGFNIFGKTNTPEFGMALTTESQYYGPCRNPWNLAHSTAGSSGGAAAAVAAGIVPVAHATDGGGSIRVPASACGVFGLKPTRALTPRGLGPSMMSVSHVVSRTVRDSAAVLDLTAGYSPGLPFVSPKPVGHYLDATRKKPGQQKIAMVLDEPEMPIHPDVREALEKTAKTLESMGHVVEDASPGVDFDRLNAAQNTMLVAEFSQGMRSLAEVTGRELSEATLEPASLTFVQTGRQTSAEAYLKAYHHVQAVTRRMAQFFEQYDLMLSPVSVTPAPELGVITERPGDTVESYTQRFRQYSAYTPLQNMTGVPAASIPVGLSREGLPVAAMLSAGLGEDARILSVCAQLESALPFLDQTPPLHADRLA